jgi:hypothetical protein
MVDEGKINVGLVALADDPLEVVTIGKDQTAEVLEVLLHLAAHIDHLVLLTAQAEDIPCLHRVCQFIAPMEDAVFAQFLRCILVEHDEHFGILEGMDVYA